MIGKDVWRAVRETYQTGAMGYPGGIRTLPSYDDLLGTGSEYRTWNGMFLSLHQCAFEAPAAIIPQERFHWGKSIPLVRFAVSSTMNPKMCCLGYEFLSNGLIWSQPERTYFFPMQMEQEIWADFTHSREFKILNQTPLRAGGDVRELC
jgi:hypothetical protein